MVDQPRQPIQGGTGAKAGGELLLEQLRRATIGEYDIHSEIARGGMASVYLAHEIALDRAVAIKLMSPTLLSEEGMVERFRREARTSAGLSHPNIIPVYAVRDVDGLCFFVMKLVKGTTLANVIEQLGKTPIAMVEALIAQVGGALDYAHRHGVIHRDLKPGNILIDDEGWAVVTDFGIAKVTDTEGLTLTGMSVGTPAYMSPEQCTGDEVGPASDQYGLGVIAYEMLTGKRPFGGATSVALMFGHAHGTAEPIESLRSDCPPRLAAAVMRMLAKRPEDRWPSLEAAIQAMGGIGYRADDQTRSQLVQLARTGQVMKLVAKANTPRSPLPSTRSKEHPAQPAAVARQTRWPLLVAGAVAVFGIGSTGYLLLNRAPDGAPSQMEPAPAPPAVGSETVPTATAPEPEPTATSAPSRPRHESPAASVGAPAPPPAPSPTPPAPIVRETPAVPPPAPTGRDSAREAADSVSSGLAQVVTTRPAESAASVQAPPPAPALVSQAEPAIVVDQRQVTQVVRRYAAALESGNMAAVRQAFPGMPEAQRQGLQSFFDAGGTLATSWTIGMPEINGAAATVRVIGSNRLTLPRSSPTTESVTLNVRLSRQLTGWRIVAID